MASIKKKYQKISWSKSLYNLLNKSGKTVPQLEALTKITQDHRKSHIDSYPYQALGHREIRLVVLHPQNENNAIHCSIKHVSIDDDPVYEALSYVWGGTADRVHFKIGSDFLHITQNLATALRMLCDAGEERTFWIDAICIDQTNTLERNHQVSFMKDIFTRASRVIVWLGEAADDSDAVMDYLATVNPTSALVEHINKKKVKNWDWSMCSPFKMPPVPIQSIDALLCRPWFSRVWTIQEAAVNTDTQVMCGYKLIKWEKLFSLSWSYGKPFEGRVGEDTLSNIAYKSTKHILTIQMCRQQDTLVSLTRILRNCTYCKATDPRDKIFAVQRLASRPSSSEMILEPDYSDEVSIVYTKFAERYLRVRGPFILRYAGRCNQHVEHNLPSWVPDWTMETFTLSSSIFRAAGKSQADCKIVVQDGLSTLATRGLTTSSISAVTHNNRMGDYNWVLRLNEHEIVQELRHQIEACIDLSKIRTKTSKDSTGRQDIWRVLVAESNLDLARLPINYGDHLVGLHEYLRRHDSVIFPRVYYNYLAMLNGIGMFTDKRFAIDSKGNMCVVPYLTRQGDSVVIIAGLNVPLVVRHRNQGGVEILGDCYVHRCMDGEVVEGVKEEDFETFTIY